MLCMFFGLHSCSALCQVDHRVACLDVTRVVPSNEGRLGELSNKKQIS